MYTNVIDVTVVEEVASSKRTKSVILLWLLSVGRRVKRWTRRKFMALMGAWDGRFVQAMLFMAYFVGFFVAYMIVYISLILALAYGWGWFFLVAFMWAFFIGFFV